MSLDRELPFYQLTDRIFFNVFRHEPHETIFPFFKKYYPHFTKKAEAGGWTMYPDIEIPKKYPIINSFQFFEHPLIDLKFDHGQFDFLSENTIGGERWSIRDFMLWFVFATKLDGETAFSTLSSLYEPISTSKKVFDFNGKKVGQFSVGEEMDVSGSIEFILTEHEIFPEKGKLLFRSGAVTYDEYMGGI